MAERPVTADTSVVVPLVCAWHEAHAETNATAGRVTRLPAHVLIEAIATLTRLPAGLAVPSAQAAAVVRQRFPDDPMTLSSEGYLHLVEMASDAGLRGGQLYDALVGATVMATDALLLTRDRRAGPTYRAIGVPVRFLR